MRVTEECGLVTLDTGVMAARVLSGKMAYPAPVGAARVPGPLQGVRVLTGEWVGTSRLQAPLKVTGCEARVTARGPHFAQAEVDYRLEGGKRYHFSLRATAGQPTVIIDEAMNLNPGGKYALCCYRDDVERSTWDWWEFDGSDHMGVSASPDGHPANAIFFFRDGLEPNQCRWRGSGTRPSQPRKGTDAAGKLWTTSSQAEEAYAPLTYEANERFNRISGWWINFFADYSNCFTIFNDGKPESPIISFSMGRPSRNVNPTLVPSPARWVEMVSAVNDLRIRTTTDRDLQAVGAICLGPREWLLTVEPHSTLAPKGSRSVPVAYRAIMKYSFFPLDKIKDWTFERPEPERAWPRLYCRPGDLAAMQQRVAGVGARLDDNAIPAIYRPGGTASDMVKQALPELRTTVENSLAGLPRGGLNWLNTSRMIWQAMPLWEAVMATPGIEPTTRARLKTYGAFLAERAWDDDF